MSTKNTRETKQENKIYDNNQQNNANKNMKEEIVMNKNTQRATWGTGQVTGGRLYCRKQPSKSAAYWGQFADGATIPIKAYDSTWYETYWGGVSSQTGYVMRQYITNENWSGSSGDTYPIAATVDTVKHGKGGTVNLRKTASDSAAVVTTIPDGSTVYVKSLTGTWLAAKYGSYTGYVMAKFIVGSNEYNASSGGGTTSNYTAIVCQGDSTDAGDCRIVYNNLSAKYGTSNVTKIGFSTNLDVPLIPCANETNFKNARNYDVLYWSSHGSTQPALNVTNGPSFPSLVAANEAWCSTSNRLKVPFFAACYQLDENKNRSGWAKIMRASNIRAICGYHEGAPGHPYDKSVATAFFNYVKAGSTGNSVMYSWQHANEDNGNKSTYMVLVYQNDNQCYYRLPGFSTKTYRDPNRNTDSIYAYASFMQGAVSSASTQAPLTSQTQLPCELAMAKTVCTAQPIKLPREIYCSMVDPKTGATFIGYGEYPLIKVDLEQAKAQNMAYAKEAFGMHMIDQAQIRNLDTEMFEVFDDNTEGKHTAIALVTQFLNQYNGIPVAENCITITSDANGLNSISNKWRDVTPIKGTKTFRYQEALSAEQKELIHSAFQDSETPVTIRDNSLIYMEKGDRYILCQDVELSNCDHVYINCMTNEFEF